MANQTDKLTYFPLRARAECSRILYALAGKTFEDLRVDLETEWPELKKTQPMGQLPTLETEDGLICQSNVIARHIARKYGLCGAGQWEETLHDLVVECAQEAMYAYGLPNIYLWMLFKAVPVPENKDEILQKAKEGWIKALNFIQSVAEKRGKKFIINDEIGLADIFLFTGLEFTKVACPEFETLTPWTTQYLEKVRNHPIVKAHLESRPAADL